MLARFSLAAARSCFGLELLFTRCPLALRGNLFFFFIGSVVNSSFIALFALPLVHALVFVFFLCHVDRLVLFFRKWEFLDFWQAHEVSATVVYVVAC